MTKDKVEKRVQANKALEPNLIELAFLVAEGQALSGGLVFNNTAELAYLISDALRFGVAVLQERGALPKKLPKGMEPKADPRENAGYM